MRTCSHCRRSYSDRSRRCPACGTWLLAPVSPGDERAPAGAGPARRELPEGLVMLCCVQSQWEADFIRALLEAEGIASAQRPSPAVTALAYLHPAAQGIEIYVRTEEEQEARELLHSGRQDVPGE